MVALKHVLPSGFADGNLNPVGVNRLLERLHHAQEVPLGAVQALAVGIVGVTTATLMDVAAYGVGDRPKRFAFVLELMRAVASVLQVSADLVGSVEKFGVVVLDDGLEMSPAALGSKVQYSKEEHAIRL